VSVRNQKPDSSENHPSYEEAAHEGKKRISTRKVTNENQMAKGKA
jgi:hypothetical protein